jgi:HK97 family phage major capsid protein/HK97 family phage prohead protease
MEVKNARAWSTLIVRSMDEDKRTLTGIASTPSTDRMGDIVEPKGAEFKLPIPFLWQHDSRQPIGEVTRAKVTSEGIEVTVQLARTDEPGVLKDRLDEAWQSIKIGLVKGLSIGFSATEYSRVETGLRFLKWLWLELSAVTIPANADCSILAIKSADLAARRTPSGASGAQAVVQLDKGTTPATRPGVPGNSPQPPKGKESMNTAEQIVAFEAKKQVALDKANAIVTKTTEEGRTRSEVETEEYNGAAAEVKAIDDHLTMLRSHEKLMLSKATPVTPASGAPAGSASADAGVEIGANGPITVRRNVEKGIAFTRAAMAIVRARNDPGRAAVIARQWRDSTPEVEAFLKGAADSPYSLESLITKTAVAAGTTSDTTWAGPLVYAQNMVSEFIEYLRPATIIGRLPGLRRVPFNIRIPRQTSGISGAFVGEGAPTPVQKPGFDSISLTWARASTIVVLTKELVEMSNPSAEALVRQDLVDGISAFLDKRFIDPSYPGVANVSPASISNGVTSRQASGATLAAVDADVGYVKTQFANAEIGMSSIWVMTPATAITLSLMRTAQGYPAFPDINEKGGTWYGLPVITSNNVVANGSPGEQQVFLVDQREVLLADDGQMMIDMSTEASLQMDSAPSAGAQSLVSLWQNGQVGIKLDRWINWAKRRSAAVQYIEASQRWGS